MSVLITNKYSIQLTELKARMNLTLREKLKSSHRYKGRAVDEPHSAGRLLPTPEIGSLNPTVDEVFAFLCLMKLHNRTL